MSDNKYDFMLDMPHHQSSKRKHMSIVDRAAQFGAFRALSGYEDAISETGRLTEEWIEPDEYEKEKMDYTLSRVLNNLSEKLKIKVEYFVADDKKSGGEYKNKIGTVKKIRRNERLIVFDDNTEISIDDISFLDIAD